jgi:hypothetical protein
VAFFGQNLSVEESYRTPSRGLIRINPAAILAGLLSRIAD